MSTFLFKFFFFGFILFPNFAAKNHPIFISVTQIEHNAKEKTIEISCKIYTDDFEKTLRKTYTGTVDLLKPKDKISMNNLVNAYIQKHLQLQIDDKKIAMQFVGYEQDEEGVICYFEIKNIATLKKINVFDNILYEYKSEQISIIHTTVNGSRKSTKLNNPESAAVFTF